MGKTIGIISIKGGVGKTTVSASLAATLANHYGKKVLAVDANYSAPNLGLHMDILEPDKSVHHVLDGKARMNSAAHNRFGVDVVPGDFVYNKQLNYLKLKDKIKSVKENYDFVVIDSSPTFNEEIMSTLYASDLIFLVATPDYPTLSCTLKTAKLAKQRKMPIAGIIINKTRDARYEIPLKEFEEASEIPVVAKIPDDKNAGRAAWTRIPVTIYNKHCPFSKEIVRLGAAVSLKEEHRPFWKTFLPFNFSRQEINRQLLREGFYVSLFGE